MLLFREKDRSAKLVIGMQNSMTTIQNPDEPSMIKFLWEFLISFAIWASYALSNNFFMVASDFHLEINHFIG